MGKSNPVFTEAQAKHAGAVVLELIKKRRFFILKPKDYERFGGWSNIDPKVFSAALSLDEQISAVYSEAKTQAIKKIEATEEKLNVSKADLCGNKQLVQCNCYTGGLNICRVYPLALFAQFVPDSLKILNEQCFQQLMGDQTGDDLSPKEVRGYKSRAVELADTIWGELVEMEASNPQNHRCVVMLLTRFSCERVDANHDFMSSRVLDIQKFPHAMGYLFHSYLMQNENSNYGYVIFNTSRESHVRITNWKNEKLTIKHDATGGYSCSVLFTAVL